MALFTHRERLAVIVLCLLTVVGWTARLALKSRGDAEITVIRGAIESPAVRDVPTVVSTAVVDINSADADQLASLPMIGPVKAMAIVEYRGQHGPFKRIEDIMSVKGIGPATFESVHDTITVGQSDSTSTGGKAP